MAQNNSTAKVISTDSPADVAGLFDTVTIRYPEDGDTETIRLVTTLRQDALQGLLSKESPLGKAVQGRKVGEQAWVDAETGRRRSHLAQLYAILDQGGIIGRKLDFLIQEFNREANTIGSKSQDVEVTRTVVDMKGEIEKIREQVQNIE